MDTPLFDTDMVTQIIYLNIPPDQQLDQRNTRAGDEWDKALNIVTESPGFKKLYWGRRLEEPEKVQLHIDPDILAPCRGKKVWDNLDLATSFTSSPRYRDEFLPLVHTLTGGASAPGTPQHHHHHHPIDIRHTTLRHQALGDPFGAALLGRPVGTAVYLGSDAAWHEGAWPLWTHVVRHVEGCMGIAGGRVREAVGGEPGAYLVYVAWRSVGHHEDYHRTEHFAKHAVILRIGVKGWTEYGHIVFREIREAGRERGTASLL